MKAASILNQVLGPIMRGPSSSHTAGAFHIAAMARDLLGRNPLRAGFRFDPGGSYAHTFVQQGADRAFVMGLLGRPLTDESFFTCLSEPSLASRFEVVTLAGAEHPNTVDLELDSAEGAKLELRAKSIGGGEVEIIQVDGWDTCLRGAFFEALVEMPTASAAAVEALLAADAATLVQPSVETKGPRTLLQVHRQAPLPPGLRAHLNSLDGCVLREANPVYFLQTGEPQFTSAQEMLALVESRSWSLGRLALGYEAQRLGLTETQVQDEMVRRYCIMKQAAQRGLDPRMDGMQLLEPSAGSVMRACVEGRLAVGGLHTRAAARALAVMHVNSAMGVVCAAPTGGSAGTLPGVVVSLAEARDLTDEAAAGLLLAAGLIGVFVSNRATFAAEVAGCQVEIGAAGAMAAAAVVEAAGGSARQATDAAAIAFQNTMGSVCDLVQGMVEIPCHTRNALAASSAFVCADLILGGYQNPIPLDETIDAVYAVGKMLPAELRCTALGGLALAPSARCLQRRCSP
jgi:L-serine dehydratase